MEENITSKTTKEKLKDIPTISGDELAELDSEYADNHTFNHSQMREWNLKHNTKPEIFRRFDELVDKK